MGLKRGGGAHGEAAVSASSTTEECVTMLRSCDSDSLACEFPSGMHAWGLSLCAVAASSLRFSGGHTLQGHAGGVGSRLLKVVTDLAKLIVRIIRCTNKFGKRIADVLCPGDEAFTSIFPSKS